MSRPTPRIELVWASPEDREAVLSVAGVSVTLTADELADLIGEAEHVHDLLTCDLFGNGVVPAQAAAALRAFIADEASP